MQYVAETAGIREVLREAWGPGYAVPVLERAAFLSGHTREVLGLIEAGGREPEFEWIASLHEVPTEEVGTIRLLRVEAASCSVPVSSLDRILATALEVFGIEPGLVALSLTVVCYPTSEDRERGASRTETSGVFCPIVSCVAGDDPSREIAMALPSAVYGVTRSKILARGFATSVTGSRGARRAGAGASRLRRLAGARGDRLPRHGIGRYRASGGVAGPLPVGAIRWRRSGSELRCGEAGGRWTPRWARRSPRRGERSSRNGSYGWARISRRAEDEPLQTRRRAARVRPRVGTRCRPARFPPNAAETGAALKCIDSFAHDLCALGRASRND